MLKKRIIPCLDVKNGRTVKGIHFLNVQDAGDPVSLARAYANQGADEIVFLDITATLEGRKALLALVTRIAREINIPFTVGGGVGTVADVAILLQAGADKVSVNSAAVRRPALIREMAGQFGSQCVVVAIDANLTDGVWRVFVEGGRKPTDLEVVEWAREVERRGAGEILLTSMAHDGTKGGFALHLIREVSEAVNIPVIASGGAGRVDDFVKLFWQTPADAALAASIFHFGEVDISELKGQLKIERIQVR